MLSVTQTDVTVCIEGASIAKLNFSEGSCRVSSGSVEEIEWRNVGLAITGGTIGNLNCIYPYLKRSTAFPAGYGVKNPETGNTLYQSGTGCGGLFRQNRGIFV